MSQHRTARPQYAAALGGLICALAVASTWWLGHQVVQTWPGSGATVVDAALLSVTLGAATLLAGWVSGVLSLAVLELLREAPTPLTFRTVRRVSVLLLALTAVPAHAAPAGPPEPSWAGPSSDSVARSVGTPDREPQEQPLLPDGSPVPLPGWTPVPASAPLKPTATIGLVSVAPRAAPVEHVVVRSGDTLWSLAARHLGGQATVQDIAEEWPRWYAANREVIGPDPDLILPGQELRIPAPDAPAVQPDPLGESARR